MKNNREQILVQFLPLEVVAFVLAELLTGPLAWQLVWPHYEGLAARAFFEAFFVDLGFLVDLLQHEGTTLLQCLKFGSPNPNHHPDEKLFVPAFPYVWVSDWPVWVPGGPRVGHIH